MVTACHSLTLDSRPLDLNSTEQSENVYENKGRLDRGCGTGRKYGDSLAPNEQGLRMTIPNVRASNPNGGKLDYAAILRCMEDRHYFDGTNLQIY